ncbi:unnamed protein product [Moneuplotes crassus]|uniref:Uncharacterized protein n=1 Tax=Euplotes crassus TaxID=5936 RepID=A0AAD1Y9G1_EUPCR|nr:unnamed protein product [Moneuplotes crassus]
MSLVCGKKENFCCGRRKLHLMMCFRNSRVGGNKEEKKAKEKPIEVKQLFNDQEKFNLRSKSVCALKKDFDPLNHRRSSQDMQEYHDCGSPSKRRRIQRKIINSIDAQSSNKKNFQNTFGLDFSLLENPLYNPFKSKNDTETEYKDKEDEQVPQQSYDTLPIINTSQKRESAAKIIKTKKLSIQMLNPPKPMQRSLPSSRKNSMEDLHQNEYRQQSRDPSLEKAKETGRSLQRSKFDQIACQLRKVYQKGSSSPKDVNKSHELPQNDQPLTFDISMRDVKPFDANLDLIEEDQYGIAKTFSKETQAKKLVKRFLAMNKIKDSKINNSIELISKNKDAKNFKIYTDYCNKLLIPFGDSFIKEKYYAHQKKWGINSKRENFYKRMANDTEERVRRKQVLRNILNKPNPRGSSLGHQVALPKDLFRKRNKSHISMRSKDQKIKARIPPFIKLKDMKKMVKIPRKVYNNN